MLPVFRFKCVNENLKEPYECDNGIEFLKAQGFHNIYNGIDLEAIQNNVISILPEKIQKILVESSQYFDEMFPDFENNLNIFCKNIHIDNATPMKTALQNWKNYIDYYRYKIATKDNEINSLENEKDSLNDSSQNIILKNNEERFKDQVVVYSPFVIENEGYLQVDMLDNDIPYFYGTTKDYVKMNENVKSLIEDILNSSVYDDDGVVIKDEKIINTALEDIVNSIEESIEADHCEGILDDVDTLSLRGFLIPWMKEYITTYPIVNFDEEAQCSKDLEDKFKSFITKWNNEQSACSYLVNNNVVITTFKGDTIYNINDFLNTKIEDLKEKKNQAIQKWTSTKSLSPNI